MPVGVLFSSGTLNVRITPDGFPVLSVDGEEVGMITHFELCTTVLEGKIKVPYGRVIISCSSENREVFIKRLRKVPWLVVDVLDSIEDKIPDTERSRT